MSKSSTGSPDSAPDYRNFDRVWVQTSKPNPESLHLKRQPVDRANKRRGLQIRFGPRSAITRGRGTNGAPTLYLPRVQSLGPRCLDPLEITTIRPGTQFAKHSPTNNCRLEFRRTPSCKSGGSLCKGYECAGAPRNPKADKAMARTNMGMCEN